MKQRFGNKEELKNEKINEIIEFNTSIYGIKEDNEYSVSFSTKTISSIPFTVKYVEDNTLAVGTEKIRQKGANGIITETYIIKSLNGKVISTKLLSKDTYNAMQKIILKGTKGAPTNIEPDTNTNNGTNINNNEPVNNGQENKIEENPKENTEVIGNNTENTNI